MEKLEINDGIAFVHYPEEINGIPVVQDPREVVERLAAGETIARFEYGDSMYPVLVSGEYAKLTPVTSLDEVKVGDAVCCNVMNNFMTHRVISEHTTPEGKCFQIGDTWGHIYGWTDIVYAIATNIGDKYRVLESQQPVREDNGIPYDVEVEPEDITNL